MRSLPLLFLSCACSAATLTTDGTVSDTSSKILSAASGDTVQLPAAGSFTWASGIVVTNSKWVVLDFNGSTITRGATSAKLVQVQNNSTGHQYVVNGKFASSTADTFLSLDGSFSNARFVVTNCTFTSSHGASIMVEIGKAYGLFSHCNFNAPDNSEHVHNLAYGASSTTGWTNDVTPGTIDQVYFEDCNWTNNATFGNPAYFLGNSCIQGYYGSRTVVRHCTFSMSQIDMHGGTLGARWWEIYSNTWACVANANQDRYCGLRSGSGLVMGNTKIGAANAGSADINMGLQASDSITYHPGLGKNGANEPMYVWNNDASMSVTYDSTVVLGSNLILTAKPDWAPLRYPHPDLDSLTQTTPTTLSGGVVLGGRVSVAQ